MSSMKMVELSTTLALEMLPIAVSFAEQTGKAFGLSQSRQLKLALAVEELLAFLAGQDEWDSTVHLTCRNGGYYTELACLFPMHVLPAAAFNITAKVSHEDDASLAEMGLLLAARTVDRLDVVKENRDFLGLRLVVEKEYPVATDELMPLLAGEFYSVQKANNQAVKQFAQRVTAKYGASIPSFFKFPGKVIDMVQSGEYDAMLAMDKNGNVGGGVFWRQTGKMIEFFGPYIFAEQDGLARMVIDQALGKLARTKAICMVNLQPTAEEPEGYFETLGEISLTGADNREKRHSVLYRQLEEDNGAVVYVNPAIGTFVKEGYDRLILPRNILSTDYAGETIPEQSAFSVALDWNQRQAFLSTLAVGQDAKENLAEHVMYLHKEGILNLFFQLDVGKDEEAILTPALLAAGFVPRLILPWGGQGDLVLFQYEEGN